jgi:hypothetical protein
LGARLDGIEEVVGSNPIGSTNFLLVNPIAKFSRGTKGAKPQLAALGKVCISAIIMGWSVAATQQLGYQACGGGVPGNFIRSASILVNSISSNQSQCGETNNAETSHLSLQLMELLSPHTFQVQ